MGERQSGNGVPSRRRVRPGDAVAWQESAHPDTAALEALLAAAMRRAEVGGEGERRAVAAFRAARDAGRHGARTRRRDDWRPREQRMPRSLKATLSVFLASLTLGGVAFAAIGSGNSSTHRSDDDRGRTGSSTGASTPPSAAPSASNSPSPSLSSSSSAPADRPTTAQDTEAQCRAYEQVKGRGKALDATAWQRLVAAAGSEANVGAYCAEQLARAADDSKPGQDRTGTPGTTGGGTGSAENDGANEGSAGSAGDAGNDGTGGDSTRDGSTGGGADNGQGQTGKAQGTKP